MLEEKWVSIPLENVAMEKLNLNFFYHLGRHLSRLTNLMAGDVGEWVIVDHIRDAKSYIKRLIATFPDLSACKIAAQDFLDHLDWYIEWYNKRLAEGDKEKVTAGHTAILLLNKGRRPLSLFCWQNYKISEPFILQGKEPMIP